MSDFLSQSNIVFDLDNDEFKVQLESEMDKAIILSELVNGCCIIGCVFERVAKKERNDQFYNYKIAFEYASDCIKDMVFTLEEIFLVLQLYNNITQPKKIPSNVEVTTNLNKIEDSEKNQSTNSIPMA